MSGSFSWNRVFFFLFSFCLFFLFFNKKMGCDVDSIWGCGVVGLGGYFIYWILVLVSFITPREIEGVRFVWIERERERESHGVLVSKWPTFLVERYGQAWDWACSPFVLETSPSFWKPLLWNLVCEHTLLFQLYEQIKSFPPTIYPYTFSCYMSICNKVDTFSTLLLLTY